MKISYLAIAAILAAGSPIAVVAQTLPAAVATAPADAALNAVIADYETYLRSVDPISAGGEGDVEAMGRVPDLSREFELAQRAPLEGFVRGG